eukprot:EG_transcript_26794
MVSTPAQPLLPQRDAMGIPTTSDFDKFRMPALLYFFLMNLVFMGLGQGFAWAIYFSFGSPAVELRLALLAEYELGWLYLASFLLRAGQSVLTALVVVWRKETKVSVPDQHVYKVFTPPGKDPLPYVLMAEEGALGCFNRAQRAAQNYVEYLPGMVGSVLLAGFVFPLPVFVCTAVFVVARVLMALQYTQAANGRRLGFGLSTLSSTVIEGLLLLVAGKALALQY